MPHDNMLDAAEFAVAMHLVRGYLKGMKLPPVLPPALRPVPCPEEVVPPAMSVRELRAYSQLFEVLDTTHLNYIDAITARDVLVTSELAVEQLASVWNLADVDRDGRLSLDEFCIACHMVCYIKKGGIVNGPVNVQSLLPHRTLKHDLQAKRRRLSELQTRKLKLMSMRERKKAQSVQESKRAHLYRERLHCLRLVHALLSEDDSVSVETILHFGDRLKEEEDNVAQVETVAQRLDEVQGRVRQESARVIMDEQRLTQEVAALEEEADKQRKKRQRNSLIKDLDPFHQLHEDRKEERLMGTKRPGSKQQHEQPKVEIPHKVDPFDRTKLHHKPLSGDKLFGVVAPPGVMSLQDARWRGGRWDAGWDAGCGEEQLTSWGGPVDERLEQLTGGFEDDFVEVWADLCSRRGTTTGSGTSDAALLGDVEQDVFTSGLDAEDTVFRTVPVTAEEDDLWCGLPPEQLAHHTEQLQHLQLQLSSIREQVAQLGDERVVMETPSEKPETPASSSSAPVTWQNPLSRRRISSDGTLESVSTASRLLLNAASATTFQRRNYGDAYNRARLLHDFSSRRSLSDSSQPSTASRGFIQEALKEREGLKEAASESSGSVVPESGEDSDRVESGITEPSLASSPEGEVGAESQKSEVLESGEATGSEGSAEKAEEEIKDSSDKEPDSYNSISKPDESNNNVIKGAFEENDEDVDHLKDRDSLEEEQKGEVVDDTSPGESESEFIKTDGAKCEVQSNDIKLTKIQLSQEPEKSDKTCTDSGNKEEEPTVVAQVESQNSVVSEGFAPPLHESKDIDVSASSQGQNLEKQSESDSSLLEVVAKTKELDNDFRTSSPWSTQQTSESFNPESVIPPNVDKPIETEEPVVVKSRPQLQGVNAAQHRISLPPNFFSEHVSPIPPPRRNSPRKKLENQRKGPVIGAPPVIKSVPRGVVSNRQATDPTQAIFVSTDSGGYPAQESTPSPLRTSPKRRAPTPPSGPPRRDLGSINPDLQSNAPSRSRPHSIAYLEHPKLGPLQHGSPIAPPRKKRHSWKQRPSSTHGSTLPEGENSVKKYGQRGVDPGSNHTVHSENLAESEEDMEAQQRKLELDRMRANLFGYQHDDLLESSVDSEESPRKSNAVILNLRDEDGDGDVGFQQVKHQNQVVLNMTSPTVSQNKATTITLSDKTSPETSHRHKTNVRLDFDDDNMNSSYTTEGNRAETVRNANERLDSLINDKPYKTIVDLSSPDVSTPKRPQSGNSRIILDLDDHQYRPETTNEHVPSGMTAEEEYMLQGRGTHLEHSRQVYKTDIYVSAQDSSTYESASNYGESESSTNLDVSSLAKSEPGELSDDSDLSDTDVPFRATFEPGKHTVSGDEVAHTRETSRTCIKMDDDGDSGITLVSYHNRSHSDSLDEEREKEREKDKTPSPKKTGVVLNLTPVSTRPTSPPPPPPVRDGEHLRASPGAPRLIKMTRNDPAESPPKESPVLKMEARSMAVSSGLEESRADDTTGSPPSSSSSEKLVSPKRVTRPSRSAPPPPRTTLSPPRHKRQAPAPPTTTPTSTGAPPTGTLSSTPGSSNQSYSSQSDHPLVSRQDSGELSAVARTGTTVFHSQGGRDGTYQFDEPSPMTSERLRDAAGETPGKAPEGATRRQGAAATGGTGSAPQRRVAATGQLHWDTEDAFPTPSSASSTGSIHGTQHSAGVPASQHTPTSPGSWGSGSTTTSSGLHPVAPTTPHTAEHLDDLSAPTHLYTAPDLLQVGSVDAGEDMDPITGLRKTGPVSAVDKAVRFVATTEPSFRVRKLDDAAPEVVDGERATLIESMRVKRKQADWMPAFDGAGDNVNNNAAGHKTPSEQMYEQRKRKNEQNRKYAGSSSVDAEGTQQQQQQLPVPPDVIPTYVTTSPKGPADIDASSINQETTKKLWEEQFASGEVSLFPRQPDTNRKRSISNQDVTNFKSEVETESIGNLHDVKKQWELKAEELAKEKEDRERRISVSKSYDNLSLPRTNSSDMPTSKSFDSLSLKSSIIKESDYAGEGDAEYEDPFVYESAIDREVRLAEEREKALRKEQQEVRRLKQAPPAPPAQTPAPQVLVATTASTVSSSEQLSPKETIIEKEIKEQQRREEQLRTEGKLHIPSHTNKEHEQSEFERREKEQERINAHESIVEREIRLQREREQEVVHMRSKLYSNSGGSTSSREVPTSQQEVPASSSEQSESHSEADAVFTEPAVHTTAAAGADHAGHQEVSSGPLSSSTTTSRTLKAPAMTSSISYEDAISTYAHTGESLIARELREQKEREDELRRRWREELGLESPLELGVSDTPYNMPDPVQPRMPGSKPKSLYDSSAPDVTMHMGSARVAAAASTASMNASGGAAAAAPERKQTKVQPMTVTEDERDSYRYVPQYETPIEREIRLARDREEEFRQMKGLGSAPSPSVDRPVVLDMQGETPQTRPHLLYRKGEEPVQEKATMQRLAHSRLQQEIQLEKQRELDLLRLGHINTTSEERKSENARYVEIIPKDATPSPTAAPPAHTPTTAAPASVRTPTTPKTPTKFTAVTSPLPIDATDGNKEVSFGPRKPARVTSAQRSMAEFKIEQELREMREREEELKKLRKITSHRVGDDSPVATNGAANGAAHAYEYQPPKLRSAPAAAPGDQLAKGPRRKSALADEWERKFSSTS